MPGCGTTASAAERARCWGRKCGSGCIRARAAGLRGSYAPTLVVRHVIQKDRLRKRYFRRWYYWNGVSRALLYRDAWIDMQAPESTEVDFSRVPHIFGVPRYFYRKAPREVRRWITRALRGDAVASFDAELWLWFFAGVLKQRWTDRKLPRPPAARRVDAEPAMSR